MKQFIYADNAATTKLDSVALAAMMPWLTNEYGNASQPYSFARKPKQALLEAREKIAKCINALPEEIFFTSGGTESDNWVIKASAYSDPKRRLTITSSIEHHAVLKACEAIEHSGYPVVYLLPDERGIVSADSLKEVIKPKTRLVSVMFSNNEIGTIEPIRDLAQIAHEYNATFHTDAVQAVGHALIDVRNLGVDMLSASAHKFNGPKGVGFLYIKKGTGIASLLDGGKQEFGLRAGTENIAAIVGMAAALANNNATIEKSRIHLLDLEQTLINELSKSKLDFRRNGSQNHIPGNISLSFKNADGEMILHRLDLMGIIVATGAACDSQTTQISHVLKAINVPKEYAHGTIRISFGKENTCEEAMKISQALVSILH